MSMKLLTVYFKCTDDQLRDIFDILMRQFSNNIVNYRIDELEEE